MQGLDLLNNPAVPMHWAALQVATWTFIACTLAWFGLRMVSRLLRRLRSQTNSDAPALETKAAGELVTRQISSGVVLLVGIFINRFLIPEVAAFQPVAPGVILTLKLSTILSMAWLLLQTGRGLRKWLDNHFDISVADNLRSRRVRTQIAFMEKIFDVTVVLLAVAICIGQFESGRKLSTGLLASAGVASLVIGLAAQRTLANLLAGFQIAFTSPIRIDDAVVVENEWGWIEEISLTYVVIRIWDRRRLVLPITYFVEKPFQNWTRKSGQILGSVFLEVAHHTPFDALNAELNRLLDESELWDGDARVLQVVEMKERCIQLRALMTARNSPECWDLRCAVRRGLVEFLVQNHPDCLPSARLALVDQRQDRAQERAPMDSWIAPVNEPTSAPHHDF
jgi:small-conductance mechanosensitive channel